MFPPYFHSAILSQIFGFYLLILSIILLSRASFYRPFFKGQMQSYAASIVGACFGLLLGLFLVMIHNYWVMKPKVLITILAWLILIKSILWLSIPKTMDRLSTQMLSGVWYYVTAIIMAVFAILLLAKGFYGLI